MNIPSKLVVKVKIKAISWLSTRISDAQMRLVYHIKQKIVQKSLKPWLCAPCSSLSTKQLSFSDFKVIWTILDTDWFWVSFCIVSVCLKKSFSFIISVIELHPNNRAVWIVASTRNKITFRVTKSLLWLITWRQNLHESCSMTIK